MRFNADELQQTLRNLPEATQQSLLKQLCSDDFSGQLTGLNSSAIQLASALLPLAATFSVAPLSGFQVGAVAVGASGTLYLGANLEFANAPLSATLHAEQSAVLNAWIHSESSITALAISAAPCGFCRQFLWELSNAPDLVILINTEQTTLAQLLPMPFGTARKPGHGLLDSSATTLESIPPIHRDHALRAIDSAQRSYTPYTHAPEGFVLECADGKHFVGRTAESIAFNPSVPAVLCALNQRNLSSSRNDSIKRCTHATLPTSLHSSCALTAAILHGISSAEIQTVRLKSV